MHPYNYNSFVFNTLIKIHQFTLSDSFGAQRYKQKPRRATLIVKNAKILLFGFFEFGKMFAKFVNIKDNFVFLHLIQS